MSRIRHAATHFAYGQIIIDKGSVSAGNAPYGKMIFQVCPFQFA